MTTSSFIHHSERGFLTIMTLFILSGLLLALSSMATLYITEKNFSELELQQQMHTSLHQMTYQSVVNEKNQAGIPYSEQSGMYSFPIGTTYFSIVNNNGHFLLYVDSQTADNFTVKQYYLLE